MKWPTITVTVTSEAGEELHRETRQAFNAGIRASEAVVRRIALERHAVCEGDQPRREGPRHEVGDTYTRVWCAQDGEEFLARVEVTAVP